MEVFSYTKEQLEDILDQGKAAILVDLVHEEYMTMDEAEEYAATTTIILKKKNFFRTLTDKWKKAPDEGGYCMLVVGNERLFDNTIPQPKSKGVLLSMLDKVLREDSEITTNSGIDTED